MASEKETEFVELNKKRKNFIKLVLRYANIHDESNCLAVVGSAEDAMILSTRAT